MNDGNVVDNGQTIDSGSWTAAFDKVNSAVLHRSLHHDPLRVLSGKGNVLRLSNGQSIFDATGGAAVACIGHGDERHAFQTFFIPGQLTDGPQNQGSYHEADG